LSGAVAKPVSINLRKLVLFPTGSINLSFILREDLLLCSSYLLLGVPNWVPNKHYQAIFLAPLPGTEEEEAPTSTMHHQSSFSRAVAGEKEDFCKGSLSLPIFYFVIVLLIYFTLFLLATFYQKYKKISSFDSWYSVTFTFSSLCCSLSTL
jgi:hypothetical protein